MTDKLKRRLYIKFRNANANYNREQARAAFIIYLQELEA